MYIKYPAVDNKISVGTRSAYSPTEFFLGKMDELAVWARVLRPSEIQSAFAKGINPKSTSSYSSTPTQTPVTQEVRQSPENKNDQIPIIIGSSIGGGFLLILGVIVLFFFLLRKRGESNYEITEVELKRQSSERARTVTKNYSDFMEISSFAQAQILPELQPFLLAPGDIGIFDKAIGAGASGVVYKGVWNEMAVAVKQLKTSDPEELRKFQLECKIMIEIGKHPNVLRIYGVVDRPFSIILEFCQFGSLHNYLAGKEPINMAKRIGILLDVAKGMIHLQSHKIIHRDLAARNW
jgi:hypothetical protein